MSTSTNGSELAMMTMFLPVPVLTPSSPLVLVELPVLQPGGLAYENQSLGFFKAHMLLGEKGRTKNSA